MKWEGKTGSHPRDIDGNNDAKEPREGELNQKQHGAQG